MLPYSGKLVNSNITKKTICRTAAGMKPCRQTVQIVFFALFVLQDITQIGSCRIVWSTGSVVDGSRAVQLSVHKLFQELACVGFFYLCHFLRRAGSHNTSAAFAALGPQIDDIVG